MEESVKKQIIIAQISEITEYIIYRKLASIEQDSANKAVLEQIASEENKHYKILQKLSGASPKPNMLKVYWYV
ncbi:MAG: rubrerythrin family protein, partial [Paludibacteraceae bacterium]|nr:rubrerythrin family protein [Paludibacteraceae bacterium]